MMTFSELKERMSDRLNPDELVEILDISSEELVEAFQYKIEERLDYFLGEFDNEEESNTEKLS